MIKSMTGFGRGNYEKDGRTYTVDIKSVNHKYTDVSVKLPRLLNAEEDKIRKRILEEISRGKVDVYISFENYSAAGTKIRINKELAKEYLRELKDLSDETGIEYNVGLIDISKFPEILKIEDEQDEELISNEVMFAVNDALEKFVNMRTVEGEKLAEDLNKRIDFVDGKVAEIEKFAANVVEDYIVKLKQRINELLAPEVADENRLNQEIVIFSDKCSIEEELTRLHSHISQFRNLLKGSSPIGKKLDFLVQEMNREVNTIGSKANCIDITNRVIELKTEIENIREQIQNIE